MKQNISPYCSGTSVNLSQEFNLSQAFNLSHSFNYSLYSYKVFFILQVYPLRQKHYAVKFSFSGFLSNQYEKNCTARHYFVKTTEYYISNKTHSYLLMIIVK